MRKALLLSFLVLSPAFAGHAQSSNTLDDVFAEVVASELPKWKQWSAGAPFKGSYATTTSKQMFGEWVKGNDVLSLNVSLSDTPEDVDSEFGSFFIRSVLPQVGKATGLGEKAALLSTCTFVDIAFARYNVTVKLHYGFRRRCDRPVAHWSSAAPSKEIERATKFARALYAAIDSERSMTSCKNDFLNTFFPRPADDREKMLESAFNGNTDAIRSLVGAGVPVSGTDGEGNSPLHLAVRHGCLDVIKALIGAKADLNARNQMQVTPMMVAADFRQTEVIRLLIEAGSDVTVRDQYGNNAAFHAIAGRRFGSLFPQPVTRQGLISLLRTLKAAGLDLNSKNDRDGDTLLTIHIGRGDRTEEWGDLIDLGVEVNGVNRQGESVLIKVVKSGVPDEGRIRTVKLLLERGADSSIKDRDGFTALDYLRQGRVRRARYPEAVRNIDETIMLLESAVDN